VIFFNGKLIYRIFYPLISAYFSGKIKAELE
jgi:hypothetical protein